MNTHPKVGAITIGQSPRPDLIEPLHAMLPNCTIVEVGALDGLSKDEIPSANPSRYPLATQLADGSHIIVEADYVAPRLQRAVAQVEKQKVSAVVLLCAGRFAELHSTIPLFNPTAFVSHLMHTLGLNHIGVVCPFPAQRASAEQKWRAEGFTPAVWVAPPDNPAEGLVANTVCNPALQAIVLDYVGHTAEQVKLVHKVTALPVFDLGHVSLTAAASILQ